VQQFHGEEGTPVRLIDGHRRRQHQGRAGHHGVDLRARPGGAGHDKLTLNVFDQSGNGGNSTLTLLDAAITALADDVLQYTPNVKIWQES
jgi:hypothetical protein